MSNNRWRPSFDPEYREKIKKLIEENELPFDKPRDFLKFCADQAIMDIEHGHKQHQKVQELLKEAAERIDEN